MEWYRDDVCMQAFSLIVLPGVRIVWWGVNCIVYSYEFSNFKVTKFSLLEAYHVSQCLVFHMRIENLASYFDS